MTPFLFFCRYVIYIVMSIIRAPLGQRVRLPILIEARSQADTALVAGSLSLPLKKATALILSPTNFKARDTA